MIEYSTNKGNVNIINLVSTLIHKPLAKFMSH